MRYYFGVGVWGGEGRGVDGERRRGLVVIILVVTVIMMMMLIWRYNDVISQWF